MSKTFKAGLAATAMFTALAAAAAPMTASAMPQANGITNCDAPGGRQQAGAAIGAVLGGLAGSQVSKNERALGAVVGAAVLAVGALVQAKKDVALVVGRGGRGAHGLILGADEPASARASNQASTAKGHSQPSHWARP